MSISMKELAKIAGVSEATVSFALNNRPGIKKSTKDTILALANEYGYIPSRNAQSLASKKSNLIGMIIPNVTNNNYAKLFEFSEALLQQEGYRLVLATSQSNAKIEEEMIRQFISFRVEGVIIYPSIKSNKDPSYLNLLAEHSIPFVYLGGYYRQVAGPVCMLDYYTSMKMATNYLLEHGCRKPCFISGDKEIVSNSLRHKGIEDVMMKQGLEFSDDDHYQLIKSNYEESYSLFSNLLETNNKYDSVIAVNTLTALGVCNAAMDKGLRIPENLSVISGDSFLPQKAGRIVLASIWYDHRKLVEQAIGMLIGQIEGKPVDKTTVISIEPFLKPGESIRDILA